jgi:outer membrane protein, heavy metal efflux system
MTRTVPAIAGFLVVVSLGGCVHFEPRPIDAETEAARFGGRTLSDGGLKTFFESTSLASPDPWPPAQWDLTRLTVAAFYYHPSLDVARAEWAEARGRSLTAGQRANPSLNVTPAYNTTRSRPSPWLPLAVLDIPFETAGKRGHRIAHAAELSEAARLNVASVAWQVRSRLRSRLVSLDAAEQTRARLAEQQAIQEENVALLDREAEAGAISPFELTQARIAADATRFALRDAERQYAEARVGVADAIGISVSALEGVELSFDQLDQLPDEGSLVEARRQALSNRSDILGALAEYAASQSALQLEIARQYPDIHLLPGYEYDQGEDKWSLGITLTLPLMNRNRGPIAEASAARETSAAQFNLLQSEVVAAVDGAVAGYRAAQKAQAEADASKERLEQEEKTAQAVYEAGETSRGELLALRLQLSAAALARLGAVVKVREALGKLEDALQSPLGLPATAWQLAPRPPQTAGTEEKR